VIDKDGAGQVAATNAPTGQGNGAWKIALTASEMTADLVVLTATGAGLVPSYREFYTEADYTPARGSNLDHLDVAISTRSTYAGADTPGTGTLLGRIPGTIAVDGSGFTSLGDSRLANLNVAVSTRAASTDLDSLATTVDAIPTASQIAADILVTPSQKIVTDANGYVTTSNPATGGSSVTEATIWAYGTRALTDKAGFSLADNSITSAKFSTATVNASATGILERLLLLAARFFPASGGSVTSPVSGNGSIVVKTTGGTTISTQSAANDGTTQTLGSAS